ncbi:MAG: DNA polymerase II [Thermoprotei archaeon]|nr:MAG: DNA polymerase II [Thermoprotei archaeon]
MRIRFWLLDITYDMVGDIPEIRMFGITDTGKRVVVCDRSFRPYFYVVPKQDVPMDAVLRGLKKLGLRAKVLSLDVVEKKYFGKPLKVVKVTCQRPPDVPTLREEARSLPFVQDVLEADIRYYMRYMIDNDIYPCTWHEVEVEEIEKPRDWQFDAVYLAKGVPKPIPEMRSVPELKVLAFDIECYNPTGAPKPEKDPVIIISIATNTGLKKLITAEGRRDRDVLWEFVRVIREFDPDIIVGYNSNEFDWPYLLERSKYVKVKLNVSRLNTEPATSVYGHISILGRANVDLYNFAEEIPEIKVKTLENVADYLGVKKKSERVLIEGHEIYRYWDDESRRPLLMRYAMDDVESILGLAEKFLPFAIQLSAITGIPLDQVGAASVGFRVEWLLMRYAYKFNELVPNRVERPAETYRGAIVLEPKPGIHENIAVLDFSAMYPNIMIKYNISPDTYVPPMEEIAPDMVYVAPEVGHRFRREPPGFYRKVLETLIKYRKAIREEMKKYPPTSFEYRILDERQKAVKVIANATYGYCGWTGARWYMREVAEAVTAWGREMIKKTINYATQLGLKVIYGDTDSIFVNYDEDRIRKLIEWVEKELGLEMKPDKIYVRVFFTEAKKRYCGLLPDGRIDIVGFEAVRGDWAEIAKEVQEKTIEIVLKERSVDKAIEYVHRVIEELRSGKVPLSKLIIWKTLSKDLSEYKVLSAHVAAAKKLLELGYKLSVGDKVGYIVTKGSGKLAQKAKPYILVKSIDEIDVEYYIDKQIIPAAMRILGYFGIKEDQLRTGRKQKSLLEFFT